MIQLRRRATAEHDGIERRRRKGQSIVEFALVVPGMLLIVMFGIDFGRAFLGWVNLQNAARIGANYAALHPTANWGDSSDPDRIKYTALVTNELSTTNCPVVTLTFPTYSSTGLGGHATVALTCRFSIITPIISSIIPNPMNMSAAAVFPVRTGTYGVIAPTPAPTATPSPSPSPTPSPTPSPSSSTSPSASPSATPTPSPTPCMRNAPQLIGQRKNNAATIWLNAGFTGGVVTLPPNANYIIVFQDKVAGQSYPCNSTVTVGP